MSTPAQQAIENTHLHYIFIIAHARTRDYSEAKDAADNAERCLTELARLLPPNSPLFPEMRQLRSIIHAARQSLSRQQQPQDLDRGLDVMSRDVVESVEGYAANRRVVSVVVVEVEPAGQRQASFGL